MTNEEIELFELTGEVVKKFFELDELHPSDKQEFVFHIHALQNIILSREGMRKLSISGMVRGSDLIMSINRATRTQERSF